MIQIKKKIKSLYYEMTLHKKFKEYHGYELNLKNPKTYNEKIYFRKYFGNFEKMALIADKYEVRKYVKEKIGEEYLIPLYGVYDKFTVDDWNKLPNSFVIKTNHGSGLNHIHIVKDKSNENGNEVVRKFQKALSEEFGLIGHQPFYRKINRKVIVEKYIESGRMTPDDYKLHCFKDKIFIQVDRGRYEKHQRSVFDCKWNELNFKLNSKYEHIEDCDKPQNLEEMITLAKKLAKDFDYIRVDFYNVNGKILFGELTQTHGNGTEDFKPTKMDEIWGEYWELDKDNKDLYLLK